MKYKGQTLSPLPIIALRLLLWPVMYVLRVLLCGVILAGWGADDAKRIWRDTE